MGKPAGTWSRGMQSGMSPQSSPKPNNWANWSQVSGGVAGGEVAAVDPEAEHRGELAAGGGRRALAAGPRGRRCAGGRRRAVGVGELAEGQARQFREAVARRGIGRVAVGQDVGREGV